MTDQPRHVARLMEANERLRADRDVLLWLHAEAEWFLALDRDEHDSAAQLESWAKQVAHAEGRYRRATVEIEQLHRVVEFEANGVDLYWDSQIDYASLRVGDRVEFERLDNEPWVPGEIVSVNPLRVLADDTGNVTTSPSSLRRPGVCSCVTALQAETLRDLGVLSPPQCSVHPAQAAAPGPHHPVGSPEGHFQSAPQRDQQHAESSPGVLPEGGAQ